MWRVSVASDRFVLLPVRLRRYLGAVLLQTIPFLVFATIFNLIGPPFESAAAFFTTKFTVILLCGGAAILSTNFSWRNVGWVYGWHAASYVIMWVTDGTITFYTGATGHEAQRRSQYPLYVVGMPAWQVAVQTGVGPLTWAANCLFFVHIRLGWRWCAPRPWRWCRRTRVDGMDGRAPASQPAATQPGQRVPCSLVARTWALEFISGVITVVGTGFVKLDETWLRPFSSSLGGVRPLILIGMRLSLGLLLSLYIALWPLRDAKEAWLRFRAVAMAPFFLAAVAGCASNKEFGWLLVQDLSVCALRTTLFLNLHHPCNPMRLLYTLQRHLAGRAGPLDVAALRSDALFSVLSETCATTGIMLGCILANGAVLLFSEQGMDAPMARYFVPVGSRSLLFMGLAVLSECAQDLGIVGVVACSRRLSDEEKHRVVERAYPALPRRVGAILVAQACAAYIVQGFVLYPLQTAFYVRMRTQSNLTEVLG